MLSLTGEKTYILSPVLLSVKHSDKLEIRTLRRIFIMTYQEVYAAQSAAEAEESAPVALFFDPAQPVLPEIDGELEEREVVSCQHCLNDYDAATMGVDDLEDVCRDCRNEHYANCNDCSETVSNDDTLRTASGDTICDECYGDNYATCEDCSDVVSDGEINSIADGNGYVCDGCYNNSYFRCEGCDTSYHDNNNAGNNRCGDCYESHDDYDSDCDCDDCQRENRTTLVKGYSTNVLDYLSKDAGKRLFGVELEVGYLSGESKKEMAEAVDAIIGSDAILKDDSSIASGSRNGAYEGFEIVTRPMSFENQIKAWTNFCESKPSALRSWDVGSCGLHIHVSRASITPLTLGKLLVFVNAPNNSDMIKRIARRDSGQWARRYEKSFTDALKGAPARMEAINLMPTHTIEFRIFRGTLKVETLLSYIEFVKAAIEFCSDSSMQSLGEGDFKKWLIKQPKLKNLKATLSIAYNDTSEEV